MKFSKAAIHRKTHRIPEIKFEGQRLTSFAGLVVYQSLFSPYGANIRTSRMILLSGNITDNLFGQ